MKSTGTRQDVAFLALAVSVLVIAVAVFMLVRSLAGRKAAEPGAAAAGPAVATTLPPKPAGSPEHDPFKGKPPLLQPQAQPTAKPVKPAPELKLVGIVGDRERLAVIYLGDERYYAKRGDQIAGYAVSEIGDDRAVLTKGAERLTLTLHVRRTGRGGSAAGARQRGR
jgi:hypothetical protein